MESELHGGEVLALHGGIRRDAQLIAELAELAAELAGFRQEALVIGHGDHLR
jgi:hypothetical protein